MALLFLSSRQDDVGKAAGSGKLFRPWAGAKDGVSPERSQMQDCTVSTTTAPGVAAPSGAATPAGHRHRKPRRSTGQRCRSQDAAAVEACCVAPQLCPFPALGCPDWAGDAKLPWLEAAQAPLLEAALDAALAQELAAAEGYARLLQGRGAAHRKLRPKKYRCPHCQVGFSNNGQLKGHIRIHTGERPFKCDATQCGKTFTRNEELTRHKRIHSGLRPYPCASCGKRFGRKDHLKKHARTHQPPPPPPLPLALYPYPYIYGY